ncbi:Polygalacturonate 4-alpha-galacturonosyltransferase [Hibiscus syriacus]|uniref:Hexosyltransferase n=1 Tax=Hibiscus syriacus TaxID=106335 RepID=A0A6A3B137_HIBSY|nr:Polygalacturonate 4-alpha-galacturonosyltransferase [Hibiscus syriacus]
MSSRSRLRSVFLILFSVLTLFVFIVGQRLYISVQDSFRSGFSEQNDNWRERLPSQSVKSFFTKEAIDVLTTSTVDLEPLNIDSFRNGNLSASWTVDGVDASIAEKAASESNQKAADLKQVISQVKEGKLLYGKSHNKHTKTLRRQLGDDKRKKHVAGLVHQDDEVTVKLENAAIERSKAVNSAVLGKYNIWRREVDNENSDSTVRLMSDQIIMAKVFISIASLENKLDLRKEMHVRLKESQQTLGESTTDADLPHSASDKIQAMGKVLAKARDMLYDCKLVSRKLRAMIQTSEEQIRDSSLEVRIWKIQNLYHYALFSDNVLAASVVVNSTIMNAKVQYSLKFSSLLYCSILQDMFSILLPIKLNFGEMNMWFLLNPPGKGTINVENVDEFKWLNSSYCPVLRQLETAAMKEYYFKEDHPTSSGSSNLKYRNPKYLSMLNHLRFYLPQVYPKLVKTLFLDDDIVVQKDLTGLWSVDLHGKVNGAVETCGESFHRFDKFLNFSNPHISLNFNPNACGWAYGMNMFDLKTWKKKDITGIYRKWQNMNEDRTLWKLGTLPPGLITFYGLTHPLQKSWHVLGLGYSPNVDKKEIERAAVIHYNGNMKPWLELAMMKYLLWFKSIRREIEE